MAAVPPQLMPGNPASFFFRSRAAEKNIKKSSKGIIELKNPWKYGNQ